MLDGDLLKKKNIFLRRILGEIFLFFMQSMYNFFLLTYRGTTHEGNIGTKSTTQRQNSASGNYR